MPMQTLRSRSGWLWRAAFVMGLVLPGLSSAGAKDWIPLTDLQAWKKPTADWQVVAEVKVDPKNPRRLLAARAGKGVMFNGPKGHGPDLLSKQKLRDVEAHVEFLIPRGSNSGVKFEGLYEIQIVDSFGKKNLTGSDCGGIYPRAELKPYYHHIDKGTPPRINAARPAGQWQTLDVIFLAPRFDAKGKKTANARFVKVVLNGKVIHEDVELKTPTGHAWRDKEVARGPLLLQGDHGPVAFRNVRVRPVNGDLSEDLWGAARKGDAGKVRALLAQGALVNARTKYGATALSFAADKGHLEVLKVLLQNGADVNATDTFYQATPMTWAIYNGHAAVGRALVDAGAANLDAALVLAVAQENAEVVRAILDRGKLKAEVLNKALAAVPTKAVAIREMLTRAGAKVPAKSTITVDQATLQSYAGTYRGGDQIEYTIALENGKLALKYGKQTLYMLEAMDKTTFRPAVSDAVSLVFERDKGKVAALLVKNKTSTTRYPRVANQSTPARDPTPAIEDKGGKAVTPRNWPSFRGDHASGVADGQWPPVVWDADKRLNIRWKTPIPGLGHSCPIVWGERVFVTTAISGDPKAKVKTGLFGDVKSVPDKTRHRWCVYCLDKRTGRIVWEKTAHEGVPRVKRHTKSTHANPTAVTDGSRVVACFGSEGIYCYDFEGKLLWQKQLGLLDSGWFYDPDYQWGFGSSPIIYQGLVIVQCDVGKNSFIAAYHITDGRRAWLTARDEIPSWGTPTIYEGKTRAELVTNGTHFVRGYDPLTGKELWRLGGNSEITVPTPIAGNGLIFVTSGYRNPKPIHAIRPGASGDITLKDTKQAGPSLAWSDKVGGPYMPTPIVYGDFLYVCSNSGLVSCYESRTGKRIYRERLGSDGSYTASPVAADGRLYFTSEEGKTHVVKAGPKFEVLAVNRLGDACLATPAVSDGMMFLRTEHFLFGVGRTRKVSG
jgi:outer membrane protein assembly factor BamB